MKLRNVLEFMGLRYKPRHYGYAADSFTIDEGRNVTFAKWQHPRLTREHAPYAFSPDDIAGYAKVIEEGDFCIDIGAHCGDTTLPMGIAAGVSGCVLGLEPNPYVYHVLEKNARANRHLANIRTIMAAAGSEQGFLELEYSDAGFCNGGRHEGISAFRHGHPYKLSVFCIDLQQELRDHYDDELKRLKLIKVDAEGYDLYILQSLLEIIDEYRPMVKAEVFRKTSMQYRLDLFDLFDSRNYDVYKLKAEPLVCGDKLDRGSMTKSAHFDILCYPR